MAYLYLHFCMCSLYFFILFTLDIVEWPFVMNALEFTSLKVEVPDKTVSSNSFQLYYCVIFQGNDLKSTDWKVCPAFPPIPCPTCNSATTLQHPTAARWEKSDGLSDRAYLIFFFSPHTSPGPTRNRILSINKQLW